MANEYGTKQWVHVPVVTTVDGEATDLLVGGLADVALIISNEDPTTTIRVRFDGGEATALTGLLVAPGRNVYFANGEVPHHKISCFSAVGALVSVHYA